MAELLSLFERSLDDDLLSKEERGPLREQLRSQNLSEAEADDLVNKIFALGNSKLKDGNSQFVLEWVRQAIIIIRQSQSIPSQAFFSPGEQCRKAIIEQISSALLKITICIFTISDDSIVDAILTAHRKGKKIRILTDNDKSFDIGSDIVRLAKAGVDVRMDTTPAHMHHKFMIVDDARLLTGSYNWTQSAARVNYENIIVTSEEILIDNFNKEFERLWTGNHALPAV